MAACRRLELEAKRAAFGASSRNRPKEMRPVPTILVIDDEPVFLRNLLLSLELEGFTAVGAADGAKALDAVDDHQPDLIISDLMLPVLDGRALLQRLQQNPLTANIPVIIVSAVAHQTIPHELAQLGAVSYFTKPVSLPQLIQAVQMALDSEA